MRRAPETSGAGRPRFASRPGGNIIERNQPPQPDIGALHQEHVGVEPAVDPRVSLLGVAGVLRGAEQACERRSELSLDAGGGDVAAGGGVEEVAVHDGVDAFGEVGGVVADGTLAGSGGPFEQGGDAPGCSGDDGRGW